MKIITAKESASLIQSEDVIATSGFMATGVAEELMIAIENRFLEENMPKDLTIIASGGQGDWNGSGIDHFAHEGLLKRLIEGYMGCEPKVCKMINENKIECYNFPIGVIGAAFRSVARGFDGELTKIGLKTYLDPRLEGGKANTRTTEDLVELVNLRDKEYLYYKIPKIDVALIRGTYADENGNISFEDEPVQLDSQEIAMATKACGGTVIVQVKEVVTKGSIKARDAVIPGNMVDYVVKCTNQEKYHRQTVQYSMHPALTGRISIVDDKKTVPFDIRKVVARRGYLELCKYDNVNLGIGFPETVRDIAEEEGEETLMFTCESGLFGGKLLGGHSFGTGMNNWSVQPMNMIFDYYLGGCLDIALLGLGQVNIKGDVNVAKLGSKYPGSGGFINITQPTKRVVFCGTFTAGDLKVEIIDGKLKIINEGKIRKFVNDIAQVNFSGEYACETNQKVLYITERCVFKLTSKGLELTEVAPGVDVEKDILANMDFVPKLSDKIETMDLRIFEKGKMGINKNKRNKC